MFLAEDFIFQRGKINPMQSWAAKVIAEFRPEDYHTGETTLQRLLGNKSRHYPQRDGDGYHSGNKHAGVCTVLDSIAHEFKVIILEDCCAA